jgi:ERCC4-type nuclease
LPAEPSPIALIDTREQNPVTIIGMTSERATLTTGDYSVAGLQHVVAIERKSLSDLLGCVGGERERFDKEVQRLLAFPVRALVIETNWPTIEAGNFERSKITAAAAMGSCLGWMAHGLPVLFAHDHAHAGRAISGLLFIAARRRWREARDLIAQSTKG